MSSRSAQESRAPPVTICALTYGEHATLARRVIDSIRQYCPRPEYRLVVGANSVGNESRRLLAEWQEQGVIDELVASPVNLGKSGMMRRLFEFVETELIWWFDDDSYIEEPGAFARWVQTALASPATTVLWGEPQFCEHPFLFTDSADREAVEFVRQAAWFRGLPPPSWRSGGKGEFNLWGRGLGDGRWLFVSGGCFMIRSSAVRVMAWPDPRLFVVAEDIMLGEAVRQQGWEFAGIHPLGVAINTLPSRGTRK